MKTVQDIGRAHDAVARAIETPGMSGDQKLLLSGMSVALQWVAGVGGVTLQMIIDGTELEPGKTATQAKQELKEDGIELDHF